MTNEEKLKVEKVVRNLASNTPNLSEEKIQKVIESLTSLKRSKDAIEKLAISLEAVFSEVDELKEAYAKSLEQILTIDETAFKDTDELLEKIKFNKGHNVSPGNMSIEENHALLNSTLHSFCTKLNELGVDYYLVGAVSAFLGSGVPLFRYHGDLDFMIAEKDINKIKELLKDSDYVFEDNRLTVSRTYDPNLAIQGDHEFLANHKENEFHLGFFLFDRLSDGSINSKEYYRGRKDGKDVPMVVIKHLPKELVDLEFTTNGIEYAGTRFRIRTPESLYAMKVHSTRPKDIIDVKALEDRIDFEKVKRLESMRQTIRIMYLDGKDFTH